MAWEPETFIAVPREIFKTPHGWEEGENLKPFSDVGKRESKDYIRVDWDVKSDFGNYQIYT